jgi:murein L,D-transpeptidase YcbB/YkuD
LAACLLFLILWSQAHLAPEPVGEALRSRVEHLHEGGAASVRGVTLLRRDAVSHFFQARGFKPVWAVPSASGQIRRAIRDIAQDGLNPGDYHLGALDALLDDGVARTPADQADLQLLLTDAVAALVDHVRYGKVRPVTLDRRWNVDPREAAPPLETELARIAAAPSVGEAIGAQAPDHFIYRGLKQALARLRAVDEMGGWPAVAAGPTLKPGASDARVAQVRARLLAGGDLAADRPPADQLYDAALEDAVKRFQEHHRLTADGAIGRSTLEAMNIPARTRAEQVRANMERARWVLGGLRDTFLLVNLPAFKVYYIRDGRNIWEAKSQIGREARQTPTFRADVRYLVFNPDWIVPPRILAEDVIGGMKKGVNVIARKNLTILDRQGRAVDPAAIDWAAAGPRNFPYTLRQPPGADNALGRVKFVFPNEHAIFLHDTPSRELFGADRRAFSSGCIRIARPLELAALLLQSQEDWTPDRIQQVVDGGRSQTVPLRSTLPIVIVYWTVSVGASGDLRFAQDVYRRDPPLVRALNGAAR